MSYRAGFLGIIGQPNAGKSTLMNFLVDEKVSIVSSKPQTTRRRILGIWSDNEGQIVFVDAPGILKAERGLNGYLAKEAEEVIRDSDALIAVVSVDTHKADDAIQTLDMVAKSKKPWLGVITKTDLAGEAHRVLILKNLIEERGGKVVQISALAKRKDAKEIREEMRKEFLPLMPVAPAPLYDIDLFTPETERVLAAEIVREKCFEFLHQEVPFALAVRLLKFDEIAQPVPRLSIEIMLSKENHKGIVIGKGGETLKQIGSAARKDIEKMLGEKIFLELNVAVRKDWADSKTWMKELGYVHERKD